MGDHSPIAYTYEADYNCPGCAEERFGRGNGGFIAIDENGDPCQDSEGNEVGVIAPWDEWHEPGEPLPQSLVCGTCHEVIATIDD